MDDLDAILAALDLPPRARRRWLEQLERFCRDHGGERRYRKLLALLDACRARSPRLESMRPIWAFRGPR